MCVCVTNCAVLRQVDVRRAGLCACVRSAYGPTAAAAATAGA